LSVSFATLFLVMRVALAVTIGGVTAAALLAPAAMTPDGARRRLSPLFAALAVALLGLTTATAAGTYVIHRIAGWRVLWGGRPWLGRATEGVLVGLTLAQLVLAIYAARRSHRARRARGGGA
jgi:hypothetical protein